jgi:phosphoglycerol transferase MdoB-like AlkP superfamily enzyme
MGRLAGAGLALAVFSMLAALLRRPLLAAAIVLAAWIALALVDRAKRRALREPLVWSDLGLFTQALRFPRLYLPYFGWARAIALALGTVSVLVAGFAFERPMEDFPWLPPGVAALVLIALGTRAARPVSLDPDADVAAFGLVGSLWRYWLEERKALAAPSPPPAFLDLEALPSRPHVVALECESFFDARRLGATASLENYDRLRAEGRWGRLAVPAWGAYTMRTEFAFLSGIANERLGVHRFDPYRRFARRPLPTLASALRSLGYRTVCVHPYPAAFFRRDLVFPRLGFDEFLDLDAFRGAAAEGPYVADREVAEKIVELIGKAEQPHFVFAITMESHGPFWLEGPDELAVYLRHLANADAMLGEIAAALREKGEGVLCAFGDHLPSLPAEYAKRGFDDPRTDYLLWNAGKTGSVESDLRVEQLAPALLGEIVVRP